MKWFVELQSDDMAFARRYDADSGRSFLLRGDKGVLVFEDEHEALEWVIALRRNFRSVNFEWRVVNEQVLKRTRKINDAQFGDFALVLNPQQAWLEALWKMVLDQGLQFAVDELDEVYDKVWWWLDLDKVFVCLALGVRHTFWEVFDFADLEISAKDLTLFILLDLED